MWIFCCGPVRSGSTLHFNLTRELIENDGHGRAVDYDYSENFPSVFSKNNDYSGCKIFKTHTLTPFMKDLVLNGKAVNIYCYRDIRDVLVSLEHKAGREIKKENDYKSFTKNYLDYYYEVKAMPNTYSSKYEDFYNNLQPEIRAISAFLKVNISNGRIEEIAKKHHYNNSKKYISKIEKSKFKGKAGQTYTIDTKTMLHANHFKHITPGSYKKWLFKENLNSIESVAYQWLKENKYDISVLKYLRYALINFF